MRSLTLALIVLTLLVAGVSSTLAAPPVTGDARVDRLLARMTLDEKRRLLHDSREDPATYQGQAGYIAGALRLGIPSLRLADGPPGVLTRRPSQAETATMGVAATFDVKLARMNGVVIGREARALGVDVALQPYINIDRDLSFKRAYNTFGEDPVLTSLIGAAEIEGIQSQHVMAVAKHFVGFGRCAVVRYRSLERPVTDITREPDRYAGRGRRELATAGEIIPARRSGTGEGRDQDLRPAAVARHRAAPELPTLDLHSGVGARVELRIDAGRKGDERCKDGPAHQYRTSARRVNESSASVVGFPAASRPSVFERLSYCAISFAQPIRAAATNDHVLTDASDGTSAKGF